ncbi:CHAP domain-containing protein [Nocardioides montaniterrae]
MLRHLIRGFLAAALLLTGLTATAPSASALESVDAFVDQWNGQFPNYDGVYGSQCVDLFDYYNRDVAGAPAQGFGNAYTIYDAASSTYYDKHTAGSGYSPIKGDVAIWNSSSPNSGGNGHVAIVLSVVNSTTIQVLQANAGLPTNDGPPDTSSDVNNNPVSIGNHSTAYLTGYLHPKNLTTSPPPPPPAPPGTNLVKGGGFESGGWSTEPGTNFVSYSSGQLRSDEKARDGSRYGATNTSQSGGGIFQDIAQTIHAGDTFCASAFVRSQYGNTASGALALWVTGTNAAENGSVRYTKVPTLDRWTPVSTCVTATSDHDNVRVQLYPAVNGGTTEIDDVSVNRSMARGGGFESGGWSTEPGTNFVSYSAGQVNAAEKPRSGSRYGATNASQAGGGIFQDVPASIGPGDTYCASAFVRSQYGGTASGTLALWVIGTNSAESGTATYNGVHALNNWRPISTCVTATQAHSAVRIQFYPTVGGGTTEIDDVNVSRSTVQSGGFESGGWSTEPGTNFVSYSAGQVNAAEKPRSGSRYGATNTSQAGGGIYQDVAGTIDPGDTYCASAYVRSQYGGSAAGSFAIWVIGANNAEGSSTPYRQLRTFNNWTPVSTCVTATQAHTAVRVQFYPAVGGGTTEIDDVGILLNAQVQRVLNTAQPTITGSTAVGKVLSASRAGWLPGDVSVGYRWYRNGKAITGATSAKHTVVAADRGTTLTIHAIGYRAGIAPSTATRSIKIP